MATVRTEEFKLGDKFATLLGDEVKKVITETAGTAVSVIYYEG